MNKKVVALLLSIVMLFAMLPTVFAQKPQTRASNAFTGDPAVFVAEDNYKISFLTNTNGMAWVEIDGVAYEDTTAGMMDWETKLHGITVPQSVLNAAKSYTICFQPLSSRPAYDPAPGATQSKTYSFDPVLTGEDPVLLCVSDQHNDNSGALAVSKYESFDALVFGGDYTDHISTEAIANNLVLYCGELSNGTKPVIYPRGNHEIRGQYSHWIDGVMPTSETGKSYYEFVLGDLYGIVLDCGGSYTDDYDDIADTIDFEPYREEQTRWLEQVYAKGTWKQYSKRVIFSHTPFVTQSSFTEIYKDWTEILNKMQMSLTVSGHTHAFTMYGTSHGSVKTAPNFPTFTMSAFNKDSGLYTGAYLTLGDQNFTIEQIDSDTLAVKTTHTVTNQTFGVTTEAITEFVTAEAALPAPAVSSGTASLPSVSSPFSAHPTVFIVEENYEIAFLTTETGMAWVEIGGVKYKDSTMGIMDWESKIHKITVPQSVLDQAKSYKICFQSMSTRKAYTPVHGDTVSRTYPFTPAPAEPTFLFMSEQLNDNTNAMKVTTYKDFDVFVCGGKYIKAANTETNRYYLLTLCGETAQGTKPTVFTRGNRELRGFAAHDVVDSMGTSSTGDAYFYFTTSDIFGIVLDTGEYAADSTASFGGTVRFQRYREEQTQWLRELLQEGMWKDYSTRIVICHIPFTAYTDASMKAVFREWTEILNEMGITLMISGHVNQYSYYAPDDTRNVSDPDFPMLTMSDLDNGSYAYSGTYITFSNKQFVTENVTSTLAVREKKLVANALYSEPAELASDYVPTGDSKVLYFGFANTLEDQQRYSTNAVYGGTNYDLANAMRTQNFYKGGGNFDFPVADIQSIDNASGTVKTKVNGPYPTQSSYTGNVTRRFIFGETNDTAASVGSLQFDPSEAEVFQVRFKLENLKLRSDIDTVDATARARSLALQYYKNNETSGKRNSNTYGGSYVNGEYMTVTLELDSNFKNADVITKVLVEFHGFVKEDDSKDAYVTLDYVYIGPKASAPTSEDGHLFFGFSNSNAAQYRYTSHVYDGINFDLGTWSVSGRTAKPTITNVNGAMSITMLPDAANSSIYVQSSSALQKDMRLHYDPSQAEYVQYRIKLENFASYATPVAGLYYYQEETAPNGAGIKLASPSRYTLSETDLTSGEYIVITQPVTEEFRQCTNISAIRVDLSGIKSISNTQLGTLTFDYIYVGPKENLPTPVYTVTFQAADGTTLDAQTVHEGEDAVFSGTIPAKAYDSENHYTFTGWDKALTNITADTTFTAQFTAEAHTLSYEVNGETHTGLCACGYSATDGHNWNGGEITTQPTCSTEGVTTYTCTDCGASKTEAVAMTGHTEVIDEAVAPTCTENGLTEGKHCATCGKVIVAQTTVDALGHTEVIDEAVAPTCTETGLTEGSHCETCGEVLVARGILDALGHSYKYADNSDKTHTVTCENCDFTEIAACVFENGECICGAVEVPEPIYDDAVKFSHSLTLENDISINFIGLGSALSVYDSFYLECKVPVYNGNELTGYEIVNIEPVYNGKNYEFTLLGVTAKMMNDDIEAVFRMTKDGQEYYSKTDVYSVAEYAYGKLNSTKATDTDELKAICANLLRYGALAQTQFNYRTDALVDANMADAHKSYLTDLATVEMKDYRKQLNDLDMVIVPWKSTTLELGNKVIMCLIVNLENYTGDPAELTMRLTYVDSNGLTVTEERPLELYNPDAQTYAVSYDGLRATEMRSIVNAAIYNGDTRVSKTVEYSIESYGARSTDMAMREICLAMLAYGDAANVFFSE